jgi:SAM-dependent methyltransferase
MTTSLHCPICASSHISLLEHRDDVPVMMHRLYDSATDARSCKRGTLTMQRCLHCGFSWNSAFDPSIVDYDDLYENAQTHSATFVHHVEGCANRILNSIPPPAKIDYLEIGCGQGDFLDLCTRLAGRRLQSAVGFDPSFRGTDGEKRGDATIHKVYFNATTAERLTHAPNVVASRHTIEHIPDPAAFLSAIRNALGPHSTAALFVETPCIDWIIEHGAMHDLFYEHCSIFNAASMTYALAQAGFTDVHVDHVFGGQYLLARGRAAPAATPIQAVPATNQGVWIDAAARYSDHWSGQIADAAKNGTISIWGAGAKGVTFAFLLDKSDCKIQSVIDINPAKQGKFLAGTGIQIVSPQTAAMAPPATIFVMNPNYMNEISATASHLGIAARLIPIN